MSNPCSRARSSDHDRLKINPYRTSTSGLLSVDPVCTQSGRGCVAICYSSAFGSLSGPPSASNLIDPRKLLAFSFADPSMQIEEGIRGLLGSLLSKMLLQASPMGW